MLLSAFFSGTELAFVSANKVRLEIDTQKGGLVNRIINMFYNNSEVFISTMLVGNNVVNVVYSMAMASLIGAPIYEMLGENEFYHGRIFAKDAVSHQPQCVVAHGIAAAVSVLLHSLSALSLHRNALATADANVWRENRQGEDGPPHGGGTGCVSARDH